MYLQVLYGSAIDRIYTVSLITNADSFRVFLYQVAMPLMRFLRPFMRRASATRYFWPFTLPGDLFPVVHEPTKRKATSGND